MTLRTQLIEALVGPPIRPGRKAKSGKSTLEPSHPVSAEEALQALFLEKMAELHSVAPDADEFEKELEAKSSHLSPFSTNVRLVLEIGLIAQQLYNITSTRTVKSQSSKVEDDAKKLLQGLKKELKRLPVRKETMTECLGMLERDIDNEDRPTWTAANSESKPNSLIRHLSAPAFIKEVWKDKIVGGRISRADIAAHDKPLLRAYDLYVGQRRFREQDAGDAAGLTLTDRSKRGRPRSPSPIFHWCSFGSCAVFSRSRCAPFQCPKLEWPGHCASGHPPSLLTFSN